MRKALPLLVALALCALAVLAAPASAGEKLSLSQARAQIRTATENWAGLMDGQAHVGACQHGSAHLVRCVVVIKSPRTRCDMRVTVSRSRAYDTLRARGVHCSDA